MLCDSRYLVLFSEVYVADFLVTCHIYESCGLLTPGELTDLRSALVNNVTFASLAVRNGFHKFMKYSSSKLMDMIDIFVQFQEEHNHVINEEVSLCCLDGHSYNVILIPHLLGSSHQCCKLTVQVLLLLEEDEVHMAEAVQVPKVLGDIFESLAGAIYLDSGLDLQEVWRVYYRLMRREIGESCDMKDVRCAPFYWRFIMQWLSSVHRPVQQVCAKASGAPFV
jgi:endoribonuclease Dicer